MVTRSNPCCLSHEQRLQLLDQLDFQRRLYGLLAEVDQYLLALAVTHLDPLVVRTVTELVQRIEGLRGTLRTQFLSHEQLQVLQEQVRLLREHLTILKTYAPTISNGVNGIVGEEVIVHYAHSHQ